MLQRVNSIAQQLFRYGPLDKPSFYIHTEEARRMLSDMLMMLCQLQPRDFGLDKKQPQFRHPKRISLLSVHETDQFHLHLFVLPQGATMPLHDHPGMVVATKVLRGEMRMRAFEWVNPGLDHGVSLPRHYLARLAPEHVSESNHLARITFEGIIGASSPPRVLFPTEGNIHEITALTPCVMFDILAPPYIPQVRDCRYFAELPRPKRTWATNPLTFDHEYEKLSLLIPTEPPDDFICEEDPYDGPRPV